MESPRLANATDFVVLPVALYGKDAEHVVAVVKSTWVLAPPRGSRPPELVLAPADMQRGVRHADVHFGDPAATSVCYPADVAIDKSGTDVVLVADACAAGGKAATHIDVKATIGPLEVMLRAHGPRVWTSNGTALTAPKATARVPLRWELAFGGRDEVELGVFVEDPRNPVGRGIAAEPEKLNGKPGPQIETVEAPIRSIEGAPAPAGVGAVGRHWEPRRTHMGTYDAAWLDGRAPLVPRNEDPRYALFAAPGLHSKASFAGGEPVTLVNLSPHEPVLRFALPRIRVQIAFEMGGEIVHCIEAPIDTVLIDLLAEGDPAPVVVVELVHRAHVVAPRRKRDLTVRVRELAVAPEAGAEAAT